MKALLASVSLLFLLLVIAVSLDPFLLLRGMALATPYRTQSIQYRSVDDSDVTIEFQMKDLGGRGYLKRTVQVDPGMFWDSVIEVDPGKIDESKWRKVEEYVNELGLKGGWKPCVKSLSQAATAGWNSAPPSRPSRVLGKLSGHEYIGLLGQIIHFREKS